jgi:ParB family chromosome partitioning protein
MTVKLLEIGVDQLIPDPNQPRRIFLQEEIDRLTVSVKARGILLPLRVLWDDERRVWRIVTGECRYRAARQAGLKTVPCLPVEGELSETDILADQIIENTVRNSLLPLELARALVKLRALKKCTSQTLAEELGISGASVTRAESLLTLPEDVQQLVDCGRLVESAAYEVSRLPDEESQRDMANLIVACRMNRDQVAEAVRQKVGRRNSRPKAGRLSGQIADGLSFTLSSVEPLDWQRVLDAFDRLGQWRREAKSAHERGEAIGEFARALRASSSTSTPKARVRCFPD